MMTLLERSASINERTIGGYTPLHLASIFSEGRNAIALLDRGATINDKNNSGDTALHLASLYGHTECVISLLNRGANPHNTDYKGRTPLDVAHNKCKKIIHKWIEDNELPLKEPDV
jgi:ankyrin repeat protein